MGLRERKKERTRRELVEAAVRLFDAHGYQATTVADIAAAADVSPATFYTYFPSKEHVLFDDRATRADLFAESLAERGPGDSPAEVIARAVEHLLASPGWSLEPGSELVVVRARLIASVPALRARALLEVAELQQQWSALLAETFPDELDDLTAAALTGAVIGAILAVAGTTLRAGSVDQALPELARRATAIALGSRDGTGRGRSQPGDSWLAAGG
ncbi:TetR/AcrR family transcriptional regulator [Saccharomonospora sp. NPDC046836]|uniref:TetR/AcrR family transcriptional regulator n=1 Tax=Saccharomonospora sp. NPDC046836 TaxID=3156921 RepID=UPI0033FC7825